MARDVPAGNAWFWGIWSVVAAFGTYFCMYGFRKPFTTIADAPDQALVFGLSLKVVLVIAQTLGYMLSKFIGIKVISEMPRERRAMAILALVGIAELALVFFGLLPQPWNAIALFFNGLPLGMVFGLVLGFLEGRRATEALAAGLCTSFILADGMTKSVGSWLLEQQVPSAWMPSVAGLVFAGPLLVFVLMLAFIPPPTRHDVAERSERVTLTRAERWGLYGRYWFGLTAIVLIYLLISILRSIRSDFAPELWHGLHTEVVPKIFSQSEMFVALGVLVVNGALVMIRDSRAAFFASLGVCGAGLALMIAALFAVQSGSLGSFPFMVLIGLGLYLPYVAIHTTVFERFLAMTREKGNLGFLMYVADAIGYLGVVAVLLCKNFFKVEGSFLGFFFTISWIAAGLSMFFLLGSWLYFATRARQPAMLARALKVEA
ncbi:DUF5690 family protein [Anatilimnocola floriformis]|uniref:DUF5690 family protein n=1 Tax=Anatilimnocola floriformis TaxID=2948575 RepID=UPI0020C54C92|nr:DUF5690 family protein [Anatilimnocola floriformis]